MSTTTITPTVGRIVWFYPDANIGSSAFAEPVDGEPLAAIVTRVIDAEAGGVHLTVFDAAGTPHSRPYVRLLQEGDVPPAAGRYATWMPYQVEQAKRHAASVCGAKTGNAAASTLAPHQQRVIDELGELDGRLLKLSMFFGTPTFAALTAGEQQLLKRQEEVMQEYSAILGERVAGFACATAG